ncbi:MAG: hypothetical protein QOK49_254 [Baekduia sp.]|nr:hypothetical protein [Baekduia sp.]
MTGAILAAQDSDVVAPVVDAVPLTVPHAGASEHRMT